MLNLISGVSSKIKFSGLLFCLMLIQPLLGATILKEIQIATEVLIIILLSQIFLQKKFKYDLLILFIMFILVSISSLCINNFFVFALNFKIYLITILILFYYSRFKHIPDLLINIIFSILFLYPLFVRVFNIWPIESMPITNENGKSFLYSRPIGFFGSPHASSQFAAIYLLYYINKKKYLMSLFAIAALLLYNSSTAIFALLGQFFYNTICTITNKKINPLVFLILVIVILFLSLSIWDSMDLSGSNDFRLSSAKVIVPMIFDLNYYQGVLSVFPKSSDDLIAVQMNTFSEIGNEIGLIKIVVEGGVILSLTFLIVLFKRIKNISIFIMLTLLHYSYIMILPLFLLFALKFDEEIGNNQ